MSQGWCTIESDPGVFTELISKIGVKGVQVSEVYELDSGAMESMKPVYGLIFLFKWIKDDKDNRATLNIPEVFFAKQVISNACATQAILNVLLNRPDIDLGPILTNYKEFAQCLSAEFRGEQMGNCEEIKIAHNKFARPEPFVFESKAATKDDDVYHFIGYVPVGSNVYELDGLKNGPILLGEYKNDNWLDVARPAIQERMQRYASKEIRFTLLALVKSRQDVFTEQLAELKKQQEDIESKLKNTVDSEKKKSLEEKLNGIGDQQKTVQMQLDDEKQVRAAWAAENVRRQHSYIPFIFNLLKILAEKGKLKELREEGKKKMEEREKKKKDDEKKKNEKAKSKDTTDKSKNTTDKS